MKEQADCFKALGDMTRLSILMMLADGEKCACDIQENFDLKQPTISHHMKILQQAELVRVEKRGKWMFYALNPERFRQLHQFMDANLMQGTEITYKLAPHDCEGGRRKAVQEPV
ncbi:ArsR/SmtB family transcription factor [Anoxynatronum buryatiense]|uniref:Transcriptional regulator, ArsR family n=1 Tax=Anoxynatronum buryatiense TaxID=489973 RepID=A0AA46AJF3_9CLOT|nr:metalloregulator ArsR/SmtB family transcription factor [Anoxynatronum buryatiense]SMP61205.1 transcriptional regulator, ArsR family [Anoxynatronum buryatiense]